MNSAAAAGSSGMEVEVKTDSLLKFLKPLISLIPSLSFGCLV